MAPMMDNEAIEALQNPRHRLTILRMELDIQKFFQTVPIFCSSSAFGDSDLDRWFCEQQLPIEYAGYFKNEEATNETINLEGWLKTGDLCYIDDAGFLFVVDRLKELIKYKGYQVPPAELEALLITHPDIFDAAVIPFPDKETGQIPVAYVVRKPSSNLCEKQVIDFISKQVAPYKKIRKVAFIKSIPKTASGKTLRKDLIKLATSKL